MKAFSKFVRPSWDELMNMDEAMAFAVAGQLPPLDDGSASATHALISILRGRKR